MFCWTYFTDSCIIRTFTVIVCHDVDAASRFSWSLARWSSGFVWPSSPRACDVLTQGLASWQWNFRVRLAAGGHHWRHNWSFDCATGWHNLQQIVVVNLDLCCCSTLRFLFEWPSRPQLCWVGPVPLEHVFIGQVPLLSPTNSMGKSEQWWQPGKITHWSLFVLDPPNKSWGRDVSPWCLLFCLTPVPSCFSNRAAI